MVVPGLTEVRPVTPLVPPPSEVPPAENTTETEEAVRTVPETEIRDAQSAAEIGGPEAGLRSLASRVATMAAKPFTKTAESFRGMKENFENKTAEKDLKQERQDYESNKETALKNQTDQIKQRAEELQGENGAQVARDALKAKGYQVGTPLSGGSEWSVQHGTIDTRLNGREEISSDAVGMSSDPRYQNIRQEKIRQFMEANNIAEADPTVQKYIEGSMDPRKSTFPSVDFDAERTFRQNFPESARQYDQKEATFIHEDYGKDPVLRKLQQEAARKASFGDKVKEAQLGSSQEKYDLAWREAYDSEVSKEYDDFVTQYPEKAKAYFVQGHEGIRAALTRVVTRDENINAFLDAKIAGKMAPGTETQSGEVQAQSSGRGEVPASAFGPSAPTKATWESGNIKLEVTITGIKGQDEKGRVVYTTSNGMEIPGDQLKFGDIPVDKRYKHTTKEDFDKKPGKIMGWREFIPGETLEEGYKTFVVNNKTYVVPPAGVGIEAPMSGSTEEGTATETTPIEGEIDQVRAEVDEAQVELPKLNKENPAAGVKSFRTEKGSVYVYDQDGKTTRFKTATGEQLERQDLTVFTDLSLSEEEDVIEAIHHPLGANKDWKVYVVERQKDSDVPKIVRDFSEVKDPDLLYLAVVNGTKYEVFKKASLKPVKGYHVFDTRHYEQDGEPYTERHLGHKVIDIELEDGAALEKAGESVAPIDSTAVDQESQANQPEEAKTIEQKMTETEDQIKNLQKEFVPSNEWQEVPPGTILPPVFEAQMDMATGKNYARWDNPPPPEQQ
jgi:hypothetical protein